MVLITIKMGATPIASGAATLIIPRKVAEAVTPQELPAHPGLWITLCGGDIYKKNWPQPVSMRLRPK